MCLLVPVTRNAVAYTVRFNVNPRSTNGKNYGNNYSFNSRRSTAMANVKNETLLVSLLHSRSTGTNVGVRASSIAILILKIISIQTPIDVNTVVNLSWLHFMM